MNNKDFIAELARRTGLKNADAQKYQLTVINIMGGSFQDGDSIQVSNFGTFEVKKKLERIMVSPTTGQRMLVPPKIVLGFKPHSNWKDQVKNGGTNDEQ